MQRVACFGLFMVAMWPTLAAAQESEFPTTLTLAPDAIVVPEGAPAFGPGTWTVQSYGSATLGNDEGRLFLSHVGGGYFIVDGLSLNLEGVFGTVDSERDGDLYAVGFDLLIHWHFFKTETWSIYADGGAGMLWTQDRFPTAGTHQNFTPQVGMGVTFRLADQINLMAGTRWHHISNARRKGPDRNPGFDGVLVYAGLMIAF
jgi:lipid A 3-O-deacylase